jgi:mono/diheme cytochrome c family protein
MPHPKKIAAVVSLSLAAALALGAAATRSASASPGDRVKRGEHLVKSMACSDCHTPLEMGPRGPELDESRSLSGHPASMELPPPPAPQGPWLVSVAATNTAWAGPWGVSFTANLTPDEETGLGRWTEQDFVQTFRSGRHMGRGRQLLPPMPVAPFANLSDDDLRAMYAYLRTIPAVKNRVPDPRPPATASAQR